MSIEFLRNVGQVGIWAFGKMEVLVGFYEVSFGIGIWVVILSWSILMI